MQNSLKINISKNTSSTQAKLKTIYYTQFLVKLSEINHQAFFNICTYRQVN